jgi:pyrimidine-nucleoside phosphorylase
LELAKTLVNIGNGFGKETIGFITNMNQPLGVAIGNWLEVVESVECLRGSIGQNDASSDLMEVTYVLSGTMVYLGRKAKSIEEGIEKCRKTIADGSAYRKFLDLIRAQGGDTDTIENLERYPLPKFAMEIKSSEQGYLSEIDSFELGMTGISLGAGRETIDDIIDMKAGMLLKKKVGSAVDIGDTLAVFYTDRENILPAARQRIAKAFKVSSKQPECIQMILDIIDKNGARKWKIK